MTLVRWQPYHRHNQSAGFSRMQRHMNSMFNNMFEGNEEEITACCWSPRVEISEQEDRYLVDADLPGLEKEDIKVEVEDNVLSITGERRLEEEKEEQNYHLRERVYGKFSRSFRLPAKVDANKINASFKNGVLSLIIPKTEDAKPKQIEVNVQ